MQAIIRRKLETGRRALVFGRDHPDRCAVHAAALDRLAEFLARADRYAARQELGFVRERGAAARRLALQQTLTPLHLRHLASVAHGAADRRLLDELARTLRELDAAIADGDEARRLHVRATADLMLAAAAVDVEVEVLDTVVRVRFADAPLLLAEWQDATRAAPARPATAHPPGGVVQPAA